MNNVKNTKDLKTYLDNENKCPHCKDGYILRNDEEGRTIASKCPYCNGGHMLKVDNIKKYSHLPNAFYDSDLTNFNWEIYKDNSGKQINIMTQKKIVEKFVWNFEDWEGMGLYIYSKTKGSGKTFLASAICNTLIKKYAIKTKFVSAVDLIRVDKGEMEEETIDNLCKCKLLVIDDLGIRQCGTDWINSVLFKILDSRINSKLSTIITSNISVSELDLDDRVVDRINAQTIEIPLPELSVRTRESDKKKTELLKRLELL